MKSWLIVLLLNFVVCNRLQAEPSRKFGLASGFSSAHLNDKDYKLVPVILRISFDTEYFFNNLDLEIPGELFFNIEPGFAHVYSPEKSQQFGCGFLLRWCHIVGQSNFHLFLEGGITPMVTDNDINEQLDGFDFLGQLGTGVTYSLNQMWELEVGIRYWHMPDMSLTDTDEEITGNTVLFGFSRRF